MATETRWRIERGVAHVFRTSIHLNVQFSLLSFLRSTTFHDPWWSHGHCIERIEQCFVVQSWEQIGYRSTLRGQNFWNLPQWDPDIANALRAVYHVVSLLYPAMVTQNLRRFYRLKLFWCHSTKAIKAGSRAASKTMTTKRRTGGLKQWLSLQRCRFALQSFWSHIFTLKLS